MNRVCILSQKGRERIEAIASSLPKKFNSFFYTFLRHPKELQIIILTVDCSTDMSKYLIVLREKVSDALNWLVRQNPAYKNIQIDYEC